MRVISELMQWTKVGTTGSHKIAYFKFLLARVVRVGKICFEYSDTCDDVVISSADFTHLICKSIYMFIPVIQQVGIEVGSVDQTIVPTSLLTDTLKNSSLLRNGSYSSPYKTGSRLITLTVL